VRPPPDDLPSDKGELDQGVTATKEFFSGQLSFGNRIRLPRCICPLESGNNETNPFCRLPSALLPVRTRIGDSGSQRPVIPRYTQL